MTYSLPSRVLYTEDNKEIYLTGDAFICRNGKEYWAFATDYGQNEYKVIWDIIADFSEEESKMCDWTRYRLKNLYP